MDVVAQKVSEFGGYLEMNSKSGEGCEFIITLPITMVSQHVLIVRIDDSLFAIPTNSLLQVFAPQSGEFKYIGDRLNFYFSEENHPTHFLETILVLDKKTCRKSSLSNAPVFC